MSNINQYKVFSHITVLVFGITFTTHLINLDAAKLRRKVRPGLEPVRPPPVEPAGPPPTLKSRPTQIPYNNETCLACTQAQLDEKLERAGGSKLKGYVARNRTEAERNFKNWFGIQPKRNATQMEETANQTTRSLANKFIQLIKFKNRKIIQRQRGKRSTETCVNKGTLSSSNNYRLCKECSATTTLATDIYPTYLNEVYCATDDTVSLSGEGTCVTTVMALTLIKKASTCTLQDDGTYLTDWTQFTQNCKVGCECQLLQKSSLLSLVPVS